MHVAVWTVYATSLLHAYVLADCKNDLKSNFQAVNKKQTYKHDEVTEVQCAPGYQKKTNVTVSATCGKDNMWRVSNEYVCVRRECPDPPTIENGRVSNPKIMYHRRDVARYVCDENRKGIPYSLVGEDTVRCINETTWYPSPPECKMIVCKFPALQNGYVHGVPFSKRFCYKNRVRFTCNPGFALVGASYSTCTLNATWVPEVPKCVLRVHDGGPRDIFVFIDDFEDLDNEDEVNEKLADTNARLEDVGADRQTHFFTVVAILGIILFIFMLGVVLLFCSCTSSNILQSNKLPYTKLNL
ncbi:m144R [Myxoma virus]|uniref:Complement control protein C3 n=2 Tax=Myxoma virus TaxID=10273 RepID=E2CZN3_9POXV|nr:m144R [Myxoma virus]AGU99826.1 m144R [Myxoma virus]